MTIVVLAPREEASRDTHRRARFMQLDDCENGITARENRPENFPPRDGEYSRRW